MLFMDVCGCVRMPYSVPLLSVLYILFFSTKTKPDARCLHPALFLQTSAQAAFWLALLALTFSSKIPRNRIVFGGALLGVTACLSLVLLRHGEKGRSHSWRIQIIESQNKRISQIHRITEWLGLEGTSRITKLQPPHHTQGHQPPHFRPAQAAQGPIQPGLQHLHGWTGHPQPLHSS